MKAILIPQDIIFQSWVTNAASVPNGLRANAPLTHEIMDIPRNLPEDAPSSHTHLILNGLATLVISKK